MSAEFDLIGVGGLACDVALRVERLPLGDEKYPAELVGRLPGGFIANATCAAARLGLRAAYIGWVGDDSDGDMLRQDFEAWDVHLPGLITVPGAVTPFTLVITDQAGQRTIVLPAFPLYQAELTYEQLNTASRARAVLTFPRDLVWCAQVRRAAIDGGGLVALDVENAGPLRGDDLRDAVHMADVVFMTQNSLKLLGVRAIQDVAQGSQWVIVTAGSRGAQGFAIGQKKPVHQPAFRVPVVDSTGAGDVFHAGLLAARLNGADLPEALAFAAAAAALKVQKTGARGGLPTRGEVEQFRQLMAIKR